jgi:2-iminobutanoate/2-iminopropanoate deaminase
MLRALTVLGICIFGFRIAAPAQIVEFKTPPELPKPNGYSHVVVVKQGTLVFVSGQVGMNSKGEMSGDFATQAQQVFANLRVALAAAGAKPANLVKLNIYVVGLNQDKLAALRAARDSVIDKQHPPASTLAGVQALVRPGAEIEVDAEAVVP